jgi:hypothetical protein
MDIHPYTHHDIARLRGEERLLRAQAAQRAHQAGEGQQAERGAGQARSGTIRLLQRIRRRRVAKALPQAGDAV